MLTDTRSKIGIPAFALTHSPTPSEPAKCSGTLTQLPAVCSFPLILPSEGKVNGGGGGGSRVEPASRWHQPQPFVTPCAVWMSNVPQRPRSIYTVLFCFFCCFFDVTLSRLEAISSQRVKCAKSHAWFLPYFSPLPHLALCWWFLMMLCWFSFMQPHLNFHCK